MTEPEILESVLDLIKAQSEIIKDLGERLYSLEKSCASTDRIIEAIVAILTDKPRINNVIPFKEIDHAS